MFRKPGPGAGTAERRKLHEMLSRGRGAPFLAEASFNIASFTLTRWIRDKHATLKKKVLGRILI